MEHGFTLTRCGLFAALVLWLVAGCSAPSAPSSDNTPAADCRDRSCPVGEECDESGCVPVRPAIYPHIQLASVLLRPKIDEAERDWRARHFDLLIGPTGGAVDLLRAVNPNIRVFEYTTFRYYLYPAEAEDWAVVNGHSGEDFLLHYREDVVVPGYESVVLVEGYPAGVVPGWNPEPAANDPTASAVEESEARVFGFRDPGHDPWLLGNITSTGYREFLVDRTRRLTDGSLYGGPNSTGPAEGVLVDHGVYYPVLNEGMLQRTTEFKGLPLDDSHPYALGFLSFYSELREELESRLLRTVDIMPNLTSPFFLDGGDPLSEAVLEATDWVWAEVWLLDRGISSPTKGSYRAISYEREYEPAVADVVRYTRAGGRVVLGARDVAFSPAGCDRGRLFTLAVYYLVHNPNTFYQYESYISHRLSFPVSQWQWNPAVTYDIGRPARVPEGLVDFEGRPETTEHYELAAGADPYDSTLTYHVWARKFTGGMVLVKMMPMGSVVDDRSLTTHPLDRPYRILGADGTPGSELVTEASIRNNEGIILVLP